MSKAQYIAMKKESKKTQKDKLAAKKKAESLKKVKKEAEASLQVPEKETASEPEKASVKKVEAKEAPAEKAEAKKAPAKKVPAKKTKVSEDGHPGYAFKYWDFGQKSYFFAPDLLVAKRIGGEEWEKIFVWYDEKGYIDRYLTPDEIDRYYPPIELSSGPHPGTAYFVRDPKTGKEYWRLDYWSAKQIFGENPYQHKYHVWLDESGQIDRFLEPDEIRKYFPAGK